MGEPAGISSEILAKAWCARTNYDIAPFYYISDVEQFESATKSLPQSIPTVQITKPADACEVFDEALPILQTALPSPAKPGTPQVAHGASILKSIKRAVQHCVDGNAGGMVTNPIQKSSMYEAGFVHPGHTEFLAELCGGMMPVMMLACPGLRTVPVTIHLSLQNAIKSLSTELIIETCRITSKDLANRFSIATPRLAVTGLNPHAGEAGELGEEEIRIIIPAINILRSEGIEVMGPFAADSLFHESARESYDVAICMYHDQALIPIKTIGFDQGVNITLGLPIVRTSPDHGTALDLAGTGQARADSLIHALELASQMARDSGHE
jgi:4-hydroxythreonine-4-phosphate dehydrogenase